MVMKYVGMFPKTLHDRTMLLWGPCSSAKDKKAFSEFFSQGKVEFAVLPDMDHMVWDAVSVKHMLDFFPEDAVTEFKVDDTGTAMAKILLAGVTSPLTLRFVKKVERTRGVHLQDDQGVAVNGKTWVKVKLFVYYFFRSKSDPWSQPKPPKKKGSKVAVKRSGRNLKRKRPPDHDSPDRGLFELDP